MLAQDIPASRDRRAAKSSCGILARCGSSWVEDSDFIDLFGIQMPAEDSIH